MRPFHLMHQLYSIYQDGNKNNNTDIIKEKRN